MVKNHPVSVVDTIPNKPKHLIESIIHGIQEKKGYDIISLDLNKIPNSVSNNFIICHGDNKIQVDAIAQSIIDTTEQECGEKPTFKEGFENSEWILLDFIDVVVHVFLKEKREFYGIENLWADAEINKIASNY